VLGQEKSATELSGIVKLARDLSCTGELIGREFEVTDSDGRLLFYVKQKPMKLSQLLVLQKELAALEMIEAKAAKNLPKKLRRQK